MNLFKTSKIPRDSEFKIFLTFVACNSILCNRQSHKQIELAQYSLTNFIPSPRKILALFFHIEYRILFGNRILIVLYQVIHSCCPFIVSI